MRRRPSPATLIAILALFFSLASSAQAVTLVTPDGQPVGGVWQRWANESKVPTGPGRVMFDRPSACNVPGAPPAGGCSSEGPPWQLYASDRYSLYFELGHIFDARYLTWHDRGTLAHIWRAYGSRWNDSAWSIGLGREDGLAADFAAAYAVCAMTGAAVGYLGAGFAPTITLPGTCRFLDRFAHATEARISFVRER